MALSIDDFTLPSVEQDGFLKICAKRYTPPSDTPEKGGKDSRRVALVFTPNVGTHRETWQTAIEALFAVQARSPSTVITICEAWAFEFLSHGKGGVLNEHALLARPKGLGAYVWTRAFNAFLASGLIDSRAEVIPVGYSASTCMIILTTAGLPLNALPYPMMILVEPPMMTRGLAVAFQKRGAEMGAKAMGSGTGTGTGGANVKARPSPNAQLEMVLQSVWTKKDIWPSRGEARAWMQARLPWKRWQPEVLDHFVEYALRDLPTATYPDLHSGVTLCCTRAQEAAGYTFYQDALDGVDRLTELCAALPVHCILGAQNDLIAAETQNALIGPDSGRKVASITRVPGAGHLVVQEQPVRLAETLWGVLNAGAEAKTNARL